MTAQRLGVKYWEIIADNLSKAGWSWGYVSAAPKRIGLRSNRRLSGVGYNSL